jgi:polyhydroxybutyrate depolymerase
MRRSIQAIVASALIVLLTFCDASAEQMRLIVDGRARTYLLERPPAQGPRPTIIMLHGYTGSGAQIAEQTGLVQPAKQAAFVAVFPDALGGRWNLLPPRKHTTRYVQLFQPSGGVPDDISFLKMLVSEPPQARHLRHQTDLSRRPIPGRGDDASDGMCGCCHIRRDCASDLCDARRDWRRLSPDPAPVPVLMLNVTGDPMVPYGGGRVGEAGLPSGVTNIWSAERLLAFFRKLNGCNDSPEPVMPSNDNRPSPKDEVQSWTGCTGGPVVFHRVVADKHIVPLSLNPAQLLIDFFRDKSR